MQEQRSTMNPTQPLKQQQTELPPIPEKLYFTIGEVAKLCDLKPHVLRYWEQEFPVLKPVKRRGNRRYYQRKDVLIVRKIRNLLYDQGFTIEGARSQLSKDENTTETVVHSTKEFLKNIVNNLEQLLAELETENQS